MPIVPPSPTTISSPMEDCPNEAPPTLQLTRKRKADPADLVDLDDHQNTEHTQQHNDDDNIRLDPSATPRIPTDPSEVSAAPAAWLLQGIWQQSLALKTSAAPLMPVDRQEGPSRPKRPRIEIPSSSLPRKFRRSRVLYTTGVPYSPRRFARHTRPAVVVVAETDTVSAVQTRTSSPTPTPKRVSQSLPVSPIEATPPVHSYTHVPPHQPPINRETLKELDLEAILRNPQLRHDLLFDPGLQFRPTFSPRKRNMAETYWLAIVRELETGCTCTTLDSHGKPIESRCICNTIALPADKPIRVFSPSSSYTTVRMPSRLRLLLTELLEVLISIIQPAVEPRSTSSSSSTSTPSTPQTLPPLPHHPNQQNASHVTYLRSILDIDLIQQEINHGLFDPSGVFQAIGDIIRCYCAPMRDHSVDLMVEIARSCAPGGGGTKGDAVRAIRMCFEIMELMKLDVANHQLQTLRPYLVHSAAQFELKMFQEKSSSPNSSSSSSSSSSTSSATPSSTTPTTPTSHNNSKTTLTLDGTRQWLQTAWDELASQSTLPQTQTQSHQKSVTDTFNRASRTQQIQMAVTRAVVNLVFDPPVHLTCVSSSSSTSAFASTFASTSTSISRSTSASTSTSRSTSASTSISPSTLTSPSTSTLSSAVNSPVNSPPSSPRPLPSLSTSRIPGSNSTSRTSTSNSNSNSKGYPETLYLDHLRLTTLRNDAADFTALYMLLMLYRQLVHSTSTSSSSSSSPSTSTSPTSPTGGSKPSAGGAGVTTEDLLALKREVWEIGPARLGWCFAKSNSGSEGVWREGIGDVVLQLVMRASAAAASSSSATATATKTSSASTTSSATKTLGASCDDANATSPRGKEKTRSRPLPTAQDLDANLLKIATSWTESHLRSDSSLSVLMKKRIKRVVEEMVLLKVLSSSSSSSSLSVSPSHTLHTSTSTSTHHPLSLPRKSTINPPADVSSALGLEPLLPEIRHLADRLGKLVGIHMNVYGALYAQPRFLKMGGGSLTVNSPTTTTNTLIRTLALTSISDGDDGERRR